MFRLRSTLVACLLSVVCSSIGHAQGPEVKQLPAKSIAKLSGFPDGVISVAYSPDGKYLAAGSYEELHLFDTEAYKLVKKVSVPAGDARSLAFHPTKPQLAVGYYQDWAVYSIPELDATVLPGLPLGNVTGVAYSVDGKLLAGSTEGEKIHIVSTDDNKLIRSLTGHSYPIQGVAFSPDGTLLASVAGDENRVTRPGEVKLWSVSTGKEIATLVEHERAAFSAVFSPDGKFLVTTSLDEKCNVYDVASQKPVGFFDGHGRPTNAAVFAAGNQVVISGGGGRAKGKNDVILWLTESGDELGKIEAHEQPIKSVAIHPDGKTLAVASEDQTVSVWNISGPLSAVAGVAKTVVAQPDPKKDADVLKIGIIGLDTSHVIAFTKAINAEEPKPEFKGFRIVAAYPKGSPDIESSTTRVPGYTKQVQEMGVEIVDSVEELAKRVDAVLLETNDGRPHLEQLIPCLKAGKPVFIDKPVAGSLVDAIAIYDAAKHYKTPVFSSSSLRYTPGAQGLRSGKIGAITGCDAYSPCSLEATHPDLYWYGIHGVETLFTIMGTGCKTVSRASTDDFDMAIGVWEDGRIGTFRGIRKGGRGYGGTAFGEKGVEQIGSFAGYEPLLVEIVKFFKSKEVPVSPEETLEIYAFMSAADESKKQGGAPVSVDELMEKSRKEASARLKTLIAE